MPFRRLLIVLAAFALAACDVAPDESGGISGGPGAPPLPTESAVGDFRTGACTAEGASLSAARSAFVDGCGAPPRDCDPIGGGVWRCSSEVIGTSAPPRAVSDASVFDGVCTVEGRNLGLVRTAFADGCGAPPRDCDPIGGGVWRCSSEVVGASAPRRPAPEPDVGEPPAPVTPPDVAPPVLDGLGLVAQWNELALAGVRASGARPTVTTRQLFIVSAAMYDAWAVHAPVATPYALPRTARRPAAEHTDARRREAISQAAYQALIALFPEFEAKNGFFREHLVALGYHPLVEAGHGAAGRGLAAARAVLAERRDDGANQAGDYEELLTLAYPEPYVPVNDAKSIDALGTFVPGFDPNRWQPLRVPTGTLVDQDDRPLVDELNLDSFGDQRFLTPHWGGVTPFALSHGSVFRPPPPPMYGSDAPYTDALGVTSTNDAAWRRQFAEVVEFSAQLDDRDKTIAEFWADGPRTESPPGHWNQLAHGLIERDGLGLGESTKLFFVLNAGLLDASIATWEAKRFHDFIRPATAIRFLFQGQTIEAWGGPNRGTQPIPAATWSPFQQLTFVTPPFPEYVSGHSTFSRVSADILTRFLGTDRFHDGVTVTAQDVDGDGEKDLLGQHVALAGSSFVEDGPATDIVLRWSTLREAADEAGLSRLYGGIHIQDGDLRGRELGARVADVVFERAQRHFDGETLPD